MCLPETSPLALSNQSDSGAACEPQVRRPASSAKARLAGDQGSTTSQLVRSTYGADLSQVTIDPSARMAAWLHRMQRKNLLRCTSSADLGLMFNGFWVQWPKQVQWPKHDLEEKTSQILPQQQFSSLTFALEGIIGIETLVEQPLTISSWHNMRCSPVDRATGSEIETMK